MNLGNLLTTKIITLTMKMGDETVCMKSKHKKKLVKNYEGKKIIY